MLTPKQQTFVELYADPNGETFGNATKSYIKAGYAVNKGTETAACRLVANVNIRKAIDEYRAKLGQKNELTREYVIKRLQKVLDSAEDKGDLTNANASLRLLGQSIGMYTDKVQTETVNAPELAEDEAEAIREAAKVAKLRLSRTGS